MPSNKVTTTIRLDEADHDILQEIAAQEVRSMNNLIEFLVKKYIQDYQKKQQRHR